MLGMSQQCALKQRQPTVCKAILNKTATSIPKEVIISLYLALVRQSLESSFLLLETRKVWINWS